MKPHAVFQRDGDDLHCEMPVTLRHRGARRRDRDAARSTARPTIKIPPETQTGQVFRLRDKGIKPRARPVTGRPVLPRRRRDAGQA
ncbi:MAG: hypothetical protein MZW92_01930 [Comamonadaceae bacterium]|nr:hypothetical protein [Comamonadaceae bacterium]